MGQTLDQVRNGEPPLTLIASMPTSDAILLAADSLSREEDGTISQVSKLYRLRDLPVAWGFSGESLIGIPFSEWMLREHWPAGIAWSEFAERVRREVNRRNRERRESASQAGALDKLRSDDLISVLVAAHLNGELDVWEFTDTGRSGSVKHDPLFAIGSGSRHARFAYFVAKHFLDRDDVLTADALNVFAHAAVFMDYNRCGPPVRIVGVSARGVEDVSVKSLENGTGA